jgi:hypothetical protein
VKTGFPLILKVAWNGTAPLEDGVSPIFTRVQIAENAHLELSGKTSDG